VAAVLKVIPPVSGFEAHCARAVLTQTINIPEWVCLAKWNNVTSISIVFFFKSGRGYLSSGKTEKPA